MSFIDASKIKTETIIITAVVVIVMVVVLMAMMMMTMMIDRYTMTINTTEILMMVAARLMA